jgi:hypothetical protein
LEATDLPTQADVLDQFLWERRYELYLQALRWSDLRRFGEPEKYQFMPVPATPALSPFPGSTFEARRSKRVVRSRSSKSKFAVDVAARYRPSNTSSTRRMVMSASVTGIG